MFFWLALFALALITITPIFVAIRTRDVEVTWGSFVAAIAIGLIPSLIIGSSWRNHAADIGKILAQKHKILVYEERVESLSKRLDSFSYPDKPGISLDSDSPWAAIINTLAEAERKLAEAKDERATAIRSIEARRYGPMSGVITFVGDYPTQE